MRQLGTFNTISQSQSGFGGNFPVWSRVRELYQGGGMIDVAKMGLKPGDIIHAGTMVKFNGAGKQVEVFTADEVTGVKAVVTVTGDIEETVKGAPAGGKLTDVNGLVFEDVCIPEGCILATCAVVRAGRIYADRVFGGGIPKLVEAQLPMIEFVRESDE